MKFKGHDICGVQLYCEHCKTWHLLEQMRVINEDDKCFDLVCPANKDQFEISVSKDPKGAKTDESKYQMELSE